MPAFMLLVTGVCALIGAFYHNVALATGCGLVAVAIAILLAGEEIAKAIKPPEKK